MNKHKLFSLLYFLTLIFFVFCIITKLPSVKLDGSLYSVMPEPHIPAKMSKEIATAFVERNKSRVIILVKDNGNGNSVHELYSQLIKCKDIEYIHGKVQKELNDETEKFILEHTASLITENIRSSLNSRKFSESSYYSAVQATKNEHPDIDPLSFAEVENSFYKKAMLFRTKNEFYYTRYQGNDWYFICIFLKTDDQSIKSRRNVVEFIDNCIENVKSKYQNSEILVRGESYNSNYFSINSLNDVIYFGSASLILIFVLIFVVFRDIIPVIVVIASTCCALIGGLFVILQFYTDISAILLGVYICLTGTICDYSIFYLFRRNQNKDTAYIFKFKKYLLPLLLIVLTDFLSYISMIFAPVDSIKQFALFSAGAITTGTLFILIVEPLIIQSYRLRPHVYFIKKLNSLIKVFDNTVFEVSAFLAVLLIVIYGIYGYKVNDDVRNIQNLPPSMIMQDLKITEISGLNNSLKFAVIHSDKLDVLLERYDELKEILYQAYQDDVIEEYNACPYNCIKTQKQDQKLLKNLTNGLRAFYKDKNVISTVNDYADTTLEFDDFMNSPAGLPYKILFHDDGVNYSMGVLLKNINNRSELESRISKIPFAYVSDYYDDIEKIFQEFRKKIYVVIFVLSLSLLVANLFYFGFRTGLICSFASILSLMFAMSMIQIFNYSFNVYNLIALAIILGLSTNYSYFYLKSSPDELSINLLGISLMLLTTLCSLSILIFSSAQIFRGIGLAIACGLICSYVLTGIIPQLLNKDEIKNKFSPSFFKTFKR